MIGLNRFEEAESDLLRAIELSPNFSQTYYSLGVLRYWQNRYEEALALFDQWREVELASSPTGTLDAGTEAEIRRIEAEIAEAG